MKMLKRRYSKTEAFGILSMIFGLGLLYDFHRRGFELFGLFMPIALMVCGAALRHRNKLIFGNILFVLGTLGLSFILFDLIAIQWVIIALIIYFGYHLFLGNHSEKIDVCTTSKRSREYNGTEPMFKNFLVGYSKSPDAIYDLDDMNFQFGLGDVTLDFSNTFIPEGETVIMIRGIVGKIHLMIPYDIELSIQSSALVGRLHILESSDRFFNMAKKYRTKDYEQGTRKIRIVASVLVGDIEVKNI